MKIVFPTDEHFPFQDNHAREVAMMIVRDFDPDQIILGSDGLDFYDISSFDKDPARAKINLQDEIDLWKAGVREWSMAAPNATRRYIPGNHEDRLRRYLWRHPEIASLEALDLYKILDFEGLGIKWDEKEYTQAEIVYYTRLAVRHGKYIRQSAGMSAKAELEADRYSISIMTGHTHRGGTVHATTRNGIVTGQECFCLCRLDPPFMARPNWQQGIVLAEVTENFLMIEAVPIHTFQRSATKLPRKVAHWNGKEYKVPGGASA
jgi:hypothetical protein